jgi:hypothetical protein
VFAFSQSESEDFDNFEEDDRTLIASENQDTTKN